MDLVKIGSLISKLMKCCVYYPQKPMQGFTDICMYMGVNLCILRLIAEAHRTNFVVHRLYNTNIWLTIHYEHYAQYVKYVR